MSTNQHPTPSDDSSEQYERGRDAFGSTLVAAARSQERDAQSSSRRQRGLAISGSLALICGLAALAIGIPKPMSGSTDDPASPSGATLVGASSAVAAVNAIRDAMDSGVLVRDVVSERIGHPDERSHVRDWTDLATRDQHVQFLQSPAGRSEYWNPSVHERVQIEPREYSSPDGRRVVSFVSSDAENASAAESPTEEIDRLLKGMREGRLRAQTDVKPGEIVLERQEKCFSQASAAYMECGALDPTRGTWPTDPPNGMTAVYSYERWWISDSEIPRILRYDNGTLSPRRTDRKPIFTTEYREWKVLPRTPANLDLVRVPDFDQDRYLILRGGNNVVSDALRKQQIVCKSARPEVFCNLR